MTEPRSTLSTWLTRRRLLARLAAASAAVGATWLVPGISIAAQGDSHEIRNEVVSFHMDQPYLDPTGRAAPYYPPAGARSASPVAHLSEEMLRSAQSYS
jgi:hypothetical protein